MRRAREVALVAVLVLLLGSTASAAGAPSPQEEGRPAFLRPGREAPQWPAPPVAIPWGRVVAGTAGVTALICFGVFLLKRLGGAPLTRGKHLELLEARPIGRNVQLFLVRVAGKVVLLAATGGNVTAVAELAEDDLPEPACEPAGELAGFKDLVRRLRGAHP